MVAQHYCLCLWIQLLLNSGGPLTGHTKGQQLVVQQLKTNQTSYTTCATAGNGSSP
jgi:hypothetical protein